MLFALYFKSGIASVIITFIVIAYVCDRISNAIHGGIDL